MTRPPGATGDGSALLQALYQLKTRRHVGYQLDTDERESGIVQKACEEGAPMCVWGTANASEGQANKSATPSLRSVEGE
ncbi:MAG: hypothetical protein DMG58_30450 [Acidobacteria bacterium]|nr:MAG: hypothetical protein DMG58_30450 [Acidobacteriota bacterium]